jgi:uncharacterized phage-associated protein
MYDARSVANEFLKIIKGAGRTLTNMQLQKLVYIAHGYSLAVLQKPLIRQSVYAWRFGPVIPDLYQALRRYGAGVVTEPINTLPPQQDVSETHRALLNTIVKAYGRYSGPQLSAMTHKEGTPWRQVYDPDNWVGEIIPDHLIQEYYLNLLHERAGINPP